METKVYVDWGKLVQVVVIVAATVTLGALDKIPPETVTLVLGTGAGYVFGNGKSVREGHSAPAPLIGRRPVDLSDMSVPDPEDPYV